MSIFDRFRGGPTDGGEAVQRDLDLAWELLAAQPTSPKVAELALRVLAAQPERSSAALLLAKHRELCGETDEARRLYRQVVGRGDSQLINAARGLRDLAFAERDHHEALSWARRVLGVDQEGWDDWLELGHAQARCGDLDEGWRQLDEAVAWCARTAVDDLPRALGLRAVYLLGTFAPPDRFVPAAEEAVRADAASSMIGLMLGWAYLVQYRFPDAEQLGLRLLREHPTDDQFQNLVEAARTIQRIVEGAEGQDITLDDIRRSGVLEMSWQQLRDQNLGTDLTSALAALDDVMPADLRASLRAGAVLEDDDEPVGSMAAKDLVAWHDGQQPGSGAAWGLPESFRLMSAAEIRALDAEAEADPAAHPAWPQNENWEVVLTDDAGSYLVVVAFGDLVVRSPGRPDEPVAASMADWIWDRLASFGGRDPRPTRRPHAVPDAELAGSTRNAHAEVRDDGQRTVDGSHGALEPRPEVLAELDRLNEACLASPGDIEPQVRLWTAMVALDNWVCINRGTAEEPRPFAATVEAGPMVCVYSSASRAQAAAHASGLLPEGAPVPMFVVPLPGALDWAMSFGERGVVGVTIDHPQIGAWCPLPNLARLKQTRGQS